MILQKKLVSLALLAGMVFSLAMVAPAGAQNKGLEDVLDSAELKAIATDSYETPSGVPVESRTVQGIVVVIINTLLGLLGVIFLVLIIYAGFLWMTAGGNDEQVGKAKGLLMNAIIGVIIIVAAYAISYFVLSAILPAQ